MAGTRGRPVVQPDGVVGGSARTPAAGRAHRVAPHRTEYTTQCRIRPQGKYTRLGKGRVG